jgi:hypothetical protein
MTFQCFDDNNQRLLLNKITGGNFMNRNRKISFIVCLVLAYYNAAFFCFLWSIQGKNPEDSFRESKYYHGSGLHHHTKRYPYTQNCIKKPAEMVIKQLQRLQ